MFENNYSLGPATIIADIGKKLDDSIATQHRLLCTAFLAAASTIET